MAQLTDVRHEKYAARVAAGETEMNAFRSAFGTGDLVLFHQIKTRPDIAARIAELS